MRRGSVRPRFIVECVHFHATRQEALTRADRQVTGAQKSGIKVTGVKCEGEDIFNSTMNRVEQNLERSTVSAICQSQSYRVYCTI